jgi:DNA-binding NarL/FixJ family response regulator
VILPTPSPAGQSRTGVLCLGSKHAGYFEDEAYALIKPLLRGLAMELQDWWHHRIKRELLARCHITDEELDLLRHEALGHSSKHIAAALGTEAKTIDCRFQRLNIKLGAANRRDAMRMGLLYGLI